MGKYIVLIEDGPVLRASLCDVLRLEGHDVGCAGDGLEGLDLIRQRIPDMIITDLRMPKMDGFELIEHLIANPSTADIPIVVITARVESDIDKRLQALGVQHILHKPLEVETLVELL